MNFLVINMEALTLGSIVLPNIFFMFYFIQSGRTAAAALPVIFFYVMAKTIPYAIRSFGKVKNPYNILAASICLTLLGTILALYQPIIPEAATLTGIGIGCLKPAYQQLKDEYRAQGKWPYSKDALYGIPYLLFALILGVALTKLTLLAFLGEIILMALLGGVLTSKLKNPWPATPTFAGPLSWRPAIATLLVFSMALGARGLKQTGSTPLIFLTLGMWLVMLVGFGRLQHRVKSSRLWTFWNGATTNFLLIYSLFYFDTLDKMLLLFAAYGLFILATVGGLLLSPRLRKTSYWWLAFPGAVLGLILSLLPTSWCYLAGLFIASLFCSTINAFIWPFYYKRDTTIPPLNTRFVRQNFNILGAVVSQVTLISLLIITNFLFDRHGRQILHAYYAHVPDLGLGQPLWITRLVCVTLLVIVAAILIKRKLPQLYNKNK